MSGAVPSFSINGATGSSGLLLKAMIERAARRLNRAMTFATVDAAEYVFYVGAPPSERRANSTCIKLIDDENAGRAGNSLRMPPRATELMELMHSLLGGDPKGLDSSTTSSIVERTVDLIRQSRPAHVLIDATGRGLVMFPIERQFAWIGCDSVHRIGEELASRRLCQMTLLPYDVSQHQPLGERRSIEPVLWQLGIAYADSGLLPWLQADSVLRLRVWPYLVTQSPEIFRRLASVLRQRPRTMEDLCRATNASPVDANAFVNASVLCGFLIAESQVSREAPPFGSVSSERPRGGLVRAIGAIRGALGIRA